MDHVGYVTKSVFYQLKNIGIVQTYLTLRGIGNRMYDFVYSRPK